MRRIKVCPDRGQSRSDVINVAKIAVKKTSSKLIFVDVERDGGYWWAKAKD